MDPWRVQGPDGPTYACRAIGKLCLANLSAKSCFGSFAKPQKHFLKEKRSLHHLEAPKRSFL